MTEESKYVRFDWAIKRILRDEANKGVLEGLVSVLLGQKITITHILESESNRDAKEDKTNRVDVKALTESGEIILVEVQLARERHFMQRILFGTSKAIIEQLQIGNDYDKIKKVYSINVLYFDLGSGSDFVYHGETVFKGMTHPDSVLQFNKREADIVNSKASVVSPKMTFPEYFLLRVNQFNEVAKTPIEEWMAYLKSGVISSDTKTPGLQEARRKLDYMKMSRDERRAYDDYMVSVHAAHDVWETAKIDGWNEGRAEGLAEGLAEGRAEGRAEGLAEGRTEGRAEGRAEGILEAKTENARNLKALGIPIETIAKALGLSIEDIEKL